LKVLDVAKWTTVFGAELLWSVVPLLILLSSLANERIDDELSGISVSPVRASTSSDLCYAIRRPIRWFPS
jgi:hypothetical protein